MLDRIVASRVWVGLLLVSFVCGAVSGGAAEKPVFKAGENGAYTFDTGVLRGTLCAGGKSSGLTSVMHIPTGTRLDGGSGIFGYYRLLATDKRYGRMGWDLPGKSRLLADGAVEITVAAAEDRPFEMVAVYRWNDPVTLDLETTIKPSANLSKFEVFLASYCSEALPDPYICAQGGSGGNRQTRFLLAERSLGDWLMFPRDKALAPMIGDGRWTKEPYPVTWKVERPLMLPIAFRRGADAAPAFLVMAPREDCCAVSTPYQGESHYSLYLSLFGRDIKAGESAQARVRFVVTTDRADNDIMKRWREFFMQFDAGER